MVPSRRDHKGVSRLPQLHGQDPVHEEIDLQHHHQGPQEAPVLIEHRSAHGHHRLSARFGFDRVGHHHLALARGLSEIGPVGHGDPFHGPAGAVREDGPLRVCHHHQLIVLADALVGIGQIQGELLHVDPGVLHTVVPGHPGRFLEHPSGGQLPGELDLLLEHELNHPGQVPGDLRRPLLGHAREPLRRPVHGKKPHNEKWNCSNGNATPS